MAVLVEDIIIGIKLLVTATRRCGVLLMGNAGFLSSTVSIAFPLHLKLNPKPYALNPKLALNPKPYALNPKP